MHLFVLYMLLKNKNVFYFVCLVCPQTGKSRKSQDLKAKSEKNDKFRKMIVVDDLSICLKQLRQVNSKFFPTMVDELYISKPI